MTSDDMEKMAEHAEHMADWWLGLAKITSGLVGAMMQHMHVSETVSARWWREQRGKADLR